MSTVRVVLWEGKSPEFRQAMAVIEALVGAFGEADEKTRRAIAEDAGVKIDALDDRLSLAEDVLHGLKTGGLDNECEFDDLTVIDHIPDEDDDEDDGDDDDGDEEGEDE